MSDSLSSTIGSVLFGVTRSIGGILPDVTVRELGTDELEITQHPVETGAAITDHAFSRPASLQLEYGWTSSALSTYSLQDALAGELPSLSLGNTRVTQVYEQLRALQVSRVPFSVVTGKRLYSSMLLESLSVETDAAKENVLMVTATCRQIIIVSTTSTTIAAQSAQAIPASTSAVTDAGTVQLVPVTSAPAFGGLY